MHGEFKLLRKLAIRHAHHVGPLRRGYSSLRLAVPGVRGETTADRFREQNTRSARRIPRDLWRGVQRKLKLLDAAARLEDLVIPAGNRLERLKGDQTGRHSIRINERYRVTFRWQSGHAYEVCVEDYH